MTVSLFVSNDFQIAPVAYKNFYTQVLKPARYAGGGTGIKMGPTNANHYLKEYKGRWDYHTASIVFDTEQDLSYFLLRWS